MVAAIGRPGLRSNESKQSKPDTTGLGPVANYLSSSYV